MHLYLRLMSREKSDSYSSSEQQALKTFLTAAPEVMEVKTIERHIKGGYAVSLEVEPGSFETLSERVSSHGLMLVL